jgi:choline dehydrogenase
MLGGSSSVNYMLTFRSDQSWWDNFDVNAGSPGTFSGTNMYNVYEDIEYLDDHGHYASNPTRGFGVLPSQTVKVDVKPHNNVNGSEIENGVNLMSTAYGIPAHFNESYNAPGDRLGAYAYSEMLQNFNTSSPELRWSGRFAFAGPDVMDQQTYTGIYPRRSAYLQNATVFRLHSLPTASGPQFVGAQFRGPGNSVHNAYARKTVIMTSGILTPAILQRSGIGPSVTLAEAGVAPVLVNENVGRHLTTHPNYAVIAAWPGFTGVSPDGPGDVNFQPSLLEDYSPVGVPGYGAYTVGFVGLGPGIGISGANYMNAKSEGTYNISSPDPFMYPRIVSNAYTDADDMLSMRDNVRYFINRTTTADPSYFPLNIDATTLNDDTLLDAWLRGPGGGDVSDHYFGTARMGTDASTAVVDNQFRVFGAAAGSLRVCDTQVIPFPTHGNPYYAAMALGDVCGNMVAQEFGTRSSLPQVKHPGRQAAAAEKKNQREPTRAAATARLTPPSDDALWSYYEAAIAAIGQKLPSNQASSLIAGIKATSDYIRLCATRCAQ